MTTSEILGGITPAVMASVVEAAPDGVLLCDSDGTIVLVNRQMEVLFGYPRAELVGRPVEMLVPAGLQATHRDHRAGFVADPATRPMGAGRALRGRRCDGSEFPLEVGLSPLEMADTRYTIARVRDVTDQVAAELRLIEAERDLAVFEDRQRIARDLHDRVVQRLFAAGMAVQSTLGRTGDPVLKGRLERAVEEIDTAILDLRSSVFELAPPGPAESVRASVLEICAEMRPALGLTPRVRFSGSIETVDASVSAALLLVLREALANVARHARARHVVVTVVAGEGLRLVVEDDGVGLSEHDGHDGGHGLGNMAARARTLGGTFAVGSSAPTGTRLEWHVPGE